MIFKFSFIFVFFLSFNHVFAQRLEAPRSMGAIGDSITAGTLALFEIKKKRTWPEYRQYRNMIRQYFRNKLDIHSFSYAGLSWSTGYGMSPEDIYEKQKLPLSSKLNQEAFFEFNDENFPVKSLYYHLKKNNMKRDIQFKNVAVPGDDTHGMLTEQLVDLNKWSQEQLGQAYPDLVTFLGGANDLCKRSYDKMTSAREYRRQVYVTLESILKKSPKSRVLVMPLMRIDSLTKNLKSEKIFKMKKDRDILTCKNMWKITQYCPTITRSKNLVEELRLGARIEQYNLALKWVVLSLRAHYSDRIRLVRNAENQTIKAEDISIDCFHPNVNGQNRLAQAAWKSSWWHK